MWTIIIWTERESKEISLKQFINFFSFFFLVMLKTKPFYYSKGRRFMICFLGVWFIFSYAKTDVIMLTKCSFAGGKFNSEIIFISYYTIIRDMIVFDLITFNHLGANLTKWSDLLNLLAPVTNWVCLTILGDWHLMG